MQVPQIIGLGFTFMIVGVCFLVAISRKRKRCYCEVQGQLEKMNLFRRPVVQYWVDGQHFSMRLNTQGGKSLFRDELPVRFNPNNPDDAYLRGNTDFVFYFLGGVFAVIGLIFLVTGIVLAFFAF